MAHAVEVTHGVAGVKSVTDNMRMRRGRLATPRGDLVMLAIPQ
jgi:hypothetical protein